jgi:hypothetical protein
MRRSLSWVLPSLLALLVVAAPAGAEIYRVTLNNGQTFETAYQPQEASWDSGMVLLLSDVGNWIGVQKADIQQVDTVSETGAFGIQIATNTFELGSSANDAEAEAEAALASGAPGAGADAQGNNAAVAAAQARIQALQLQLAQQQAAEQQRAADQSYSVQQFVEPTQTQGIPSRFIGTPSTPPK